jgi:hypothetical protein
MGAFASTWRLNFSVGSKSQIQRGIKGVERPERERERKER